MEKINNKKSLNLNVFHCVRYQVIGEVNINNIKNNFNELSKLIALTNLKKTPFFWIHAVPEKKDSDVSRKIIVREMSQPINASDNQLCRIVLLIYLDECADLIIVSNKFVLDYVSLQLIATTLIKNINENFEKNEKCNIDHGKEHCFVENKYESTINSHHEKSDYFDNMDLSKIMVAIGLVYAKYSNQDNPVIALMQSSFDEKSIGDIGSHYQINTLLVKNTVKTISESLQSISLEDSEAAVGLIWDIEKPPSNGLLPNEYIPCSDSIFPFTVSVYRDADKKICVSGMSKKNSFSTAVIEKFIKNTMLIYDQLNNASSDLLSETDELSEDEKKNIIALGRNENTLLFKNKRIEKIFSDCAKRYPTLPAVSFENETVTYRELDERTTAIARSLRHFGVVEKDFVGICLERSIDLIVMIISVLKTGATYVPIDPNYPKERIAYTVNHAELKIVITTMTDFPTNEGFFITTVTPENLAKIKYDELRSPLMSNSVTNRDPAYVIYTSGSTGRPKGVVIPHSNVVNLINATVDNFKLASSDTWTLFHSCAFDFSVWEMWGALLTGGHLVVVPYWVTRSTEEFYELIINKKVTILNQTPSAFSSFMQIDQARNANFMLRLVIFGGEQLDTKMLLPWFDRRPETQCRLINMFGITETTVHVTYETITRHHALTSSRSVGKTLPGWYFYIMNSRQQLLPIGTAGEIYVGGVGVALEYLHNSELTAERFMPDPFQNGMMYRTGDKGRLRTDGNMEYLGRLDSQIKLRGFRIELDEIKSVILEAPLVKASVVILNQTIPNDAATSRLDAYVILEKNGNINAVKEYVRRMLPDYMIPSTFTEVSHFPLTTNGKLDVRNLPLPNVTIEKIDVSTADEKNSNLISSMLSLWQKILGVSLTVDDNFFEMGGNSLLVVRLLAAMREYNLPEFHVREIYVHQTIRNLVAFFENKNVLKKTVGDEKISKHEIKKSISKDLYLASPQQRRIYVEQLKDLFSVKYNLPLIVDLPNKISIDGLKNSFEKLTKRHEIFRTQFLHLQGKTYQKILPEVKIDFSVIECHNHDDEIKKHIKTFDLNFAPLWRIFLFRNSNGNIRMLFDIHHILTDGFSLANLFSEWSSIYHGIVLSNDVMQYRDYSEWVIDAVKIGIFDKQKEFWLKIYDQPVQSLRLPYDFQRPSIKQSNAGYIIFHFGELRTNAIRNFAKKEKITIFHVLLSVYGIFLNGITNQDDVTVGTPMFGRHITHTDVIQGMFVNTVCLRLHPKSSLRCIDYLCDVSNHVVLAFENQDYPFDELAHKISPVRDVNRNPMFDTLFSMQNTQLNELKFFNNPVSWVPEETGETIFDLNFQIYDLEKELTGSWSYSTQLFLEPTIEFFKKEFLFILDSFLNHPEQTIGNILLSKKNEVSQSVEIEFSF